MLIVGIVTRPPSAVLRCVILSMLVLLASCSSTGFVYNRLDFLLPWYLERYVDLDREQSRRLDERLAPLLSWHRYEELPTYVAYLEQIERALDAPLSEEQLEDFTHQAEVIWQRLRERGLDELLVLGEGLNNAQIDEFLGEMDKRQQKYERKYLTRTESEFREDAVDELSDGFKDYLGRLQREQRQRVKLAADQLQRSDHYWLSGRKEWVALLAVELERQPGWQERVRTLVREWESGVDPAVNAVYEHNNRVLRQAIVDVVNTRTAKQDARLRKEIRSLRDDLQELATRDDP